MHRARGSDPGAIRIEWRADRSAVLRVGFGGAHSLWRLEVARELDAALTAIEAEPDLVALALALGPTSSAESDLRCFADLRHAHDGADLSREWQRVTGRLSTLCLPTVAAIPGPCRGALLELALACRRRVAGHEPGTLVAFPEVEYGLMPLAGATQRLPEWVGVRAALDLLQNGRSLSPEAARSLGLVDELVAAGDELPRAVELGLEVGRKRRRLVGIREVLVAKRRSIRNNPVSKRLELREARRELAPSEWGLGLAQRAILDAVQTGVDQGIRAGLEVERQHFGELAVGPRSRQLVQFFLSILDAKGMAADAAFRVDSLGIIGTGSLAGEVVESTVVRAQLPVLWSNYDLRGVREALRCLDERLEIAIRRGTLRAAERDLALQRIELVDGPELLSRAAVVIDLSGARPGGERTRDLEVAPVWIRDVGAGSCRTPSLWLHYAPPLEERPLLEVVEAPETAPLAITRAEALGRQQGRVVIVVRDSPGLYAVRLRCALLDEAIRLLLEGCPVECVDRPLVMWGFRLGPFATADTLGLEVYLRAAQTLERAFGERFRLSSPIAALVGAGRLGRKSLHGFYQHRSAERVSGHSAVRVDRGVYRILGVQSRARHADAEVVQRCVGRLVNEAALCLGSGVIRGPQDGDVGAVLGAGFPAFRGGPFRYMDEVGLGEVVRRSQQLERELGSRFAPASLLLERVRTRTSFHDGSSLRPSGASASRGDAANRAGPLEG